MKIFNKYFKISDPILTMLLCSGKKVILTCFFKHNIICVCAKFEVCLTPATGFLALDDTFWTNIQKKYFSLKFGRVLYQSSCSDQVVAKLDNMQCFALQIELFLIQK